MINQEFRMSIFRLCTIFLAAFTLSACQTTGGVSPAEDTSSVAATAAGAPKYEEFITTGQLLPIESVVNIDGEIIDLTVPDKRKLVILFATWCPDSNHALQALNQSELLNDDSVEIIAIAREETSETVIAWRDEHGIRTPLAVDPVRSIFNLFAAAGVPRFITVSADNKGIKMNLAEEEDPLRLIEWQ